MDKVTKPFDDFSLHPQLKSALKALEFENCTPIQERAMPHILNGQDVAGLAQTGTGKTAAFMLPMIERILRSTEESGEIEEDLKARVIPDWKKRNFVLVLVPTRELAEQVKECAKDFLKGTDHNTVVVYGGVSIERQVELLNKEFTFLVATPGRLIDLYKQHKIDLKQVRAVIFDEADRMFDMGFKDDMKYILRRIPDNRQLLLFSATLNFDVFNVAYQFGSNPIELNVSEDQATAENVQDKIFHLGKSEKPQHLLALLNKHKPKQVIIFTNFKSNVDRIAEFLNRNGQKALGISSLITQSQRKRVMTQFRDENGDNILVATDVAARGLDIQGVDMVVNFELPDDAENYVHRIGRTGRAGEKGNAFSFVSDKDVEALERIEKYLDKKVEADWMDSEDLPEEYKPFPEGELLQHKNRSRKPPSKYKGGRRTSGQGRGGEKDKDGAKDSRRADSRSKPRRNSRDKDRDRDRDKRKDGEKREAGESKSVHRDKRSGRHRGADDQKRSASSKKKRRTNNQNQRRKNSKSRPQQSRKPAAKKQSLFGKVIKKLFG